MNRHKIGLALTGRISHIPDSQRIFGALIYLYAELYSPEEATKLVSSIRSGEIYVSLSNLLPGDYFPVPQTYLLDRLASCEYGSNDQRERKRMYRALKKRPYTTLEQITRLISEPKAADQVFPYASLKSSYHIHAAIDSLRYNMPGLDSNVYSVPEVVVMENVGTDIQPSEIKDFHFYIGTDSSPEAAKLLDAIQTAKYEKRRFFLGPRASQGLNTYVVKHVEPYGIDEDTTETHTYLNLGMLLPDQINFEQSSLRIFTSERRPYHLPTGWDQHAFPRKFISFIDAGSIVYAASDLASAGRSIPSPFNESRDIVFGNAFLLPIRIGQEARI